MAKDRSQVPEDERAAVIAELRRQVEAAKAASGRKGAQGIVAQKLGMSQQTISAAIGPDAKVGGLLARSLLEFLGISMAELKRIHGIGQPIPVQDPSGIEAAVMLLGERIGPEAVRRVRARAGLRVELPIVWAREILAEQRRILEELELSFSLPEHWVTKNNR
jgi:hypothetical protein